MGRSPCCPKEGLNRGAWTAHEDKVLKDYIRLHGEGRWRNLPKRAGLKRCGKSCRLRWLNYLRPDIKRGNISSDEEELIIRLHKLLGNRWSLIAGRLPGRTDNEIKNYWNTNLGKKVKDHTKQTSSSSLRGFAPPQNANTTLNPNPQLPQTQQPPPKVTLSTPSPTPPKTDSHVVRTKATKCTKVLLINPPPLPNSSPTQPQKNPDAATEAKVVVNADAVPSISNDYPLSNNYEKESNVFDNHVILSLFGDEDTDLSTEDLLMDYDVVGDVCLSELLNSDFCGGFSYGDNNSSNDDELSLPGSDQQPPVFSDEIFKDWTQSNFATEEGSHSLSNKIRSFTPVLETIDE